MTHEENLFIVSLSEFLFEDVQDTREHSKDEIIDEVACDGGVLAWSTIYSRPRRRCNKTLLVDRSCKTLYT